MMEDKIKMIGEALTPHPIVDECEIDLSVEYEEPKFTLKFGGVGTLPRGDIQAIKAKSKNGKSFLCAVFMASVFGSDVFPFESLENAPVVLYFDTEQNKRNTAKLARCAHSLLGWDIKQNHKDFHAYSLRTMETPERLPFIDKTISEQKPTITFIDGIADLIENFNDVEQSSDLINHLMRLSADNDCAIVCVLHTNKGKDDSGMKGHLGTMLLQKASDVFEVRKTDGTFNVTESDCRNQPIGDFAFSIDGHGVPMPTTTLSENRQLVRLEGIRKTFKDVFATVDELSFTDLLKSYELNGAVSESTAKRAVRTAKSEGIIKLTPNDKYALS